MQDQDSSQSQSADHSRGDLMTVERLSELLDHFARCRIAVVGDYFLDEYLDVEPELVEPSIETGLDAHQVVDVRVSPGAAGTVVNNLAALGVGTLTAIGAIGDDGNGFELRRALEQRRCETGALFACPELLTPTYLKPRDRQRPGLQGEHSRYDILSRRPMPQSIVERVMAAVDVQLPELDAIIVADQIEQAEHGVVTSAMRRFLESRVPRYPAVVFWADSRRRIREFRNLTVKPNQFEVVGWEHPVPGDRVERSRLQEGVQALRARNKAPVFVTLGEHGILVADDGQTMMIPGYRVPGPIDTTGAGDSVTAGAVATLAAGGTVTEAAVVGNLVASVTIQQLSTTGTATPQQLRERFLEWQNPSA